MSDSLMLIAEDTLLSIDTILSDKNVHPEDLLVSLAARMTVLMGLSAADAKSIVWCPATYDIQAKFDAALERWEKR